MLQPKGKFVLASAYLTYGPGPEGTGTGFALQLTKPSREPKPNSSLNIELLWALEPKPWPLFMYFEHEIILFLRAF